MGTPVWIVLVPAENNNRSEFLVEHHQRWDAFVRKITGGVTIMKSAKGHWLSPTGKLYSEKVIPCTIICTKEQVLQIVEFTATHYHQEAIAYYKISDEAYIYHTAK